MKLVTAPRSYRKNRQLRTNSYAPGIVFSFCRVRPLLLSYLCLLSSSIYTIPHFFWGANCCPGNISITSYIFLTYSWLHYCFILINSLDKGRYMYHLYVCLSSYPYLFVPFVNFVNSIEVLELAWVAISYSESDAGYYQSYNWQVPAKSRGSV